VLARVAGGHAGQKAERALGWTACLGVIDGQELSFGAGDRELIRP
jgi:hypothetical protein